MENRDAKPEKKDHPLFRMRNGETKGRIGEKGNEALFPGLGG